MTSTFRPDDLVDSTVVDADGSKIGKVGTVYLADDSRQPEWVTVRTGLFGRKESFVPLQGATMDSDGVHVRVSKSQVNDAPQTEADRDLSSEESAELYRHYNMAIPRQQTAPPEETVPQQADTRKTPEAAETTTPTEQERARTRPEGESMVRHEERLRVGTDEVETGRVRLRKYVVTESQQVTVPVSHEEVRLEREPITEEDRRASSAIGEEEQEMTLHAEQPHVETESVPVEKVRLGKERVTEEETISDEVRKEQFDIDTEAGRHHKRE